jgi:hypothetical protein
MGQSGVGQTYALVVSVLLIVGRMRIIRSWEEYLAAEHSSG